MFRGRFMKSYIFITNEGYTFQPESEAIEPDVENCQVIGFAQGLSEEQAFENMVEENEYLMETTFDELICLELRHIDYYKQSRYFHLDDHRSKAR